MSPHDKGRGMPEATSTAPPPAPRPITQPLFGSPTPSRPFGLGRLPGTPYVIESILGAGGMAGVYRARHLGLERHVALKVLHANGANDIAALEWLHREARILARFKHPGVLQVHDLGISDDGRPFVALEYVDGPDLQTLVDDEAPLSPARAVRLAAASCEALAAVHAAGVVHRDVKPENIALVDAWTSGETTMLLDFGIAIGPDDPPLTGEGMTVGTPGFVAPEQAMGEAVDGRADQYGLAMVLYQLLTGRHPYRRGDVLETLEAQLSKPVPSPSQLRPGLIGETLSGVVLRGLALEPDDRYPDMLAFRDALLAAVGAPALDADEGLPAGVERPPPVSRAESAPPAGPEDGEPPMADSVTPTRDNSPRPTPFEAAAPAPEGWTPTPGRTFLQAAAVIVAAAVVGLMAGRWSAPAPGGAAGPSPPAAAPVVAAEPPGVTPPIWTTPPASWPDDAPAACLAPTPLDWCRVAPAAPRPLGVAAVELGPTEASPPPGAEPERNAPAKQEPPPERPSRSADKAASRRDAPGAAAPVEAQDQPSSPPPLDEAAADDEDAPPRAKAVGASELLLDDGPLVDQALVTPP